MPLLQKVFLSSRYLVLISLITVICSGCSLSPERESPESKNLQSYRPATLSPTDIFEKESHESSVESPILDNCVNNLEFLDDITIPDGTIVTQGDTLDKRWEVKNSGTCNWDETYYVRLVAGDDLGVSIEKALYPARSGTNAEIRIEFTAPEDPGIYRSQWKAFDSDDQPFGDPFYIEVVVGSE